MTSSNSEKAKKYIIGRYTEWVTKFDVRDYSNNPPLIQKLYEEKQLALSKTIELEEEVDMLNKELKRLEMTNQKLDLQLAQYERQSAVIFALSLMAVILTGIGINVITDTPSEYLGWILIVIAVILEVLVFWLSFIRGRK